MNKILNIVFYESEKTKEKRAKIFYKNNIVEDVDYDSALEICLQFVKENDIKTMSEFKNILNNDLIYVKSEKDLIANMEEYKIDKDEIPTIQKIGKIIEEKQEEIEMEENKEKQEEVPDAKKIIESADEIEEDNNKEEGSKEETIDDYDIKDEIEEENEDTIGDYDIIDETEEEKENAIDENNIMKKPEKSENDNYDVFSKEEPMDEDEDLIDINNSEELEKNKKVENKENNKEEYKGIKGFFKKIKDKLAKNKIIKRIILCVTALAVGLGIYSAASRKTLEGRMANSNLASITNTNLPKTSNNDNDDILIIGDNSYYNNYDFNKLIKLTGNEQQKTAMTNNYEMLKGFNEKFANAYQEKGIKPALTFDEVMALQAAYNDYSKDDIKKIFNGSEIKSRDLDNYYKSASLQLMGAYVIETRENPFDASILINSKEGKEFYKKYHKLFIDAKYAKTGEKQQEAVKKFYAEVKKDFPITKEVRTEGISHADDHNSIEAYKLSVTPMIAAAEMLFQNLKVDNTLKDGEIDFINDIGLCNYAKESFNRIETILQVSEANKEEPLYEQYKNSIIKMMKENNSYVIDDAHRELSKLTVFQLAVNGHFDQVINGDFSCNKTIVSTYTDTKTTYREEVTVRELPITDEAKRQIDSEIERDNAAAKREGESQAESKRKQMQDEEDKKAKKINSEVEQDEKDMQKKINDANDNISSGKTVNEEDFGNHNVDFDDEHSDQNGDLDKSVKDITTDGSGADNEPLPDPNETGRKFDAAPVGTSNEAIVDQYIESLAATSTQEDEKGFQYVK